MDNNYEWNYEERQWLSRAKRLFNKIPKDIRLYLSNIDGAFVACKYNIKSDDLDYAINQEVIQTGDNISDMHDEVSGRGKP